MTEFEQQLAAVDKKITRARKRMTGLHAERDLILAGCPHTDIEAKHNYVEGGYLNTAYTEHWNQCRVCGARSPVETVNHGTYA
jgi:predicted aconitase